MRPTNAQDRPPGAPLRPMGAVPIIARLVGADGHEWWIPAEANRWTSTHVLVIWKPRGRDPRQYRMCWLPIADVTRTLRTDQAQTWPHLKASPPKPTSL